MPRKHILVYSKHTEIREHSHGRESARTEILVLCSCGWRVKVPDIYSGFRGGPSTDEIVERRVCEHKIDVLLKAAGIKFEGDMPMSYDLKETKGWED